MIELTKIFSAVPNIKHRTILMLVYSSGLRVSEVVKLRTEDIDVHNSKNRCGFLSRIQ
ncbi:hypothetical protein C5S30_00425 [ANME-1 cluster archaeon GoMg4]|nr:hypothetical protein [ANME-1 cluster archaeon GoMg4]